MTWTGDRSAAPFWRTAAVLVVASILYCAPLFSNLDNWGRKDWDQFTFRYDTPRTAILRDHVLPTWNPYANGGTVLLAHPDSPVLSPWYLLVLVLGAEVGLRVQVVLFMALGAVGMAALVGRLGASRAGSLAGGIVFMMSSHFALHIAEGHLEWCVLGLMPWLALCLLRLQDGMRYVILAALLLASVLTFGAVYIPAVFLPFLSVWILFEAVRKRQWQPLLQWSAVVLVAVLLASVKLLPTAQFTLTFPRVVARDQRTPPRAMLRGLLDPRQALLYKVTRDRDLGDGHFAKSLPRAQAAPLLESLYRIGATYGFHEYGGYIGVAGILLAAWGAFCTWRWLWPLYAAGAFSGIMALGASSPLDLWLALRHLPLYSQLQVPSRFLAAVVFALAVAAAFGIGALADRLRTSRPRWATAAQVLVLAALYAELTLLGWTLFRDVFVVPPVALAAHDDFAQRFVEPSLHPRVMSSTMQAYLRSNSGTLKGYENLSVQLGQVLTPSDTNYRGEVYLDQGRGTARIRQWTMSKIRVDVAATEPQQLILNQNFAKAWSARRRDASGGSDVVPARRSPGGLVAVPVAPEHREVELFYLPGPLIAGAWISGVTLLLCLVGLWFSSTPRGRRTQSHG